jgi:hypothetical protein
LVALCIGNVKKDTKRSENMRKFCYLFRQLKQNHAKRFAFCFYFACRQNKLSKKGTPLWIANMILFWRGKFSYKITHQETTVHIMMNQHSDQKVILKKNLSRKRRHLKWQSSFPFPLIRHTLFSTLQYNFAVEYTVKYISVFFNERN